MKLTFIDTASKQPKSKRPKEKEKFPHNARAEDTSKKCHNENSSGVEAITGCGSSWWCP